MRRSRRHRHVHSAHHGPGGRDSARTSTTSLNNPEWTRELVSMRSFAIPRDTPSGLTSIPYGGFFFGGGG